MLTLYQTLRVVPNELAEAAEAFRYNPWQKILASGVHLFISGVTVEYGWYRSLPPGLR
ncbi:ABC-type anion transport system, duplicated permease component [Salmonella enterica subsp. arizonae]|uniref:ABC-type anion transport system, duplicated permease component n=1 Tax=Salmonella enterica subsp. arizonae TaxID=59203 RepID=A0A379SQX1_SALER|nr:ABC-type anion transport system, duplicated permease component [Salmonella enterica subsp. arizonae]